MAKFVASNDPNKVDASPTKKFFVDIITKDIELEEAIQDLIDNSVDGARRLAPSGDFQGLWVKLTVDGQRFIIEDNCGGIPLDIARKYAFKFGRAKGFATTKSSVGQFGIGMKRALFKIGQKFEVKTTSLKEKYEIEVDVNKWMNDDENWDFDLKNLKKSKTTFKSTGTELKVEPLAEGVPDQFSQDDFILDLKDGIRSKHQYALLNGLQIHVNGLSTISDNWRLLESHHIQPVARSFEDKFGPEHSLMTTRLFAGIGDSNRSRAGWYVFCNGRCILEADQSKTTGWSDIADGVAIPKYHGQFARFRGYVFLESEDASILPWNTTKTGLDKESDSYRRLKPRLIEAMRPIIDYLNNLDGEKDLEKRDRVLTQALASATGKSLETLSKNLAFSYTAPAKKGPPMTRITYRKPKKEAEKLKATLRAGTFPVLGEKTFDYCFENLVDED